MSTVERRIFAYNFTAKRNIMNVFEQYYEKLGNDKTNIKERNLIYHNSGDTYSYFLDLEKKNLKARNSDDKDKITTAFLGTIYQMRGTDLPLILDLSTGIKRGLQLAQADSLAEQTHFVVLPELNLLLAEYNHVGARVERIRSILDYNLNLNSDDMVIVPILRKDNYGKVLSDKPIKELILKSGHLGYNSLHKSIGFNLFDDLSENFDELSNFDIEVKITAKRGKKIVPKHHHALLNGIVNLAKGVVSRRSDGSYNSNEVSKIKAKFYEDGKSFPIDLLEEKLVHQISVIKLDPSYKFVDSNDMFAKILDLYRNNIFSLDRYIPIVY